VVGTELGLLPRAVATSTLAMAPGERYDVVLDFTGHARNAEIILRNGGIDGGLFGFADANGTTTNRPTDVAFGDGNPTDPRSTGQIMKFKVSQKLSKAKKGSVVAGTKLGPALPTLRATKTRKLMAFLGTDAQGRDMEMLGNIGAGGTKMWMEPVTEIVAKGTTEIWEIYNTSVVAHPVHLHLVDFQVLDRAPFQYTSVPKAMMDGGTGGIVTVTGTGPRRKPETYERGRKDTVLCYPGEVTRIIATFDRPGNYVWHCHILHHEDHDMMRPITVR
jgi:spore coat protein A